MRNPLLTAISTIVAVAGIGCPDSPAPLPTGPAHDEDACTQFIVPQAMGLGWGRLNHRMSTWSVRTDRTQCEAKQLQVTHIGGDFSTGDFAADDPSVRFAWQEVSTEVTQVGVARVTIPAVVGPEGVVTVSETFDREELELRHYPTVVAVIDGLRFETAVEQSHPDYPSGYDPALGYTMRGFGVGVRVTTATAENIAVEADFRFDPANSPDRPNLNEAIEFAEVGAQLDVLLIGVAGVPVHDGEVEYSMSYPKPERLVDQEIEPPDDEMTLVTVNGAADGAAGFFGLARFDYQFQFDGSCETTMDCADFAQETCEDDGFCSFGGEEPGEYIRNVTVGVQMRDYDPEAGVADFQLQGYASNASRFVANFALEYDFSGRLIWVQAGEVSEQKQLEETFSTGDATFPLE